MGVCWRQATIKGSFSSGDQGYNSLCINSADKQLNLERTTPSSRLARQPSHFHHAIPLRLLLPIDLSRRGSSQDLDAYLEAFQSCAALTCASKFWTAAHRRQSDCYKRMFKQIITRGQDTCRWKRQRRLRMKKGQDMGFRRF